MLYLRAYGEKSTNQSLLFNNEIHEAMELLRQAQMINEAHKKNNWSLYLCKFKIMFLVIIII